MISLNTCEVWVPLSIYLNATNVLDTSSAFIPVRHNSDLELRTTVSSILFATRHLSRIPVALRPPPHNLNLNLNHHLCMSRKRTTFHLDAPDEINPLPVLPIHLIFIFDRLITVKIAADRRRFSVRLDRGEECGSTDRAMRRYVELRERINQR